MIRTPFLILFLILGVGTIFGIAYAPALMTITLSGNVVATDNLDVNGVISSPTISDLDARISVIEGGI